MVFRLHIDSDWDGFPKDLSAAPSERWNQRSGRSDSDSDDNDRHQKIRRSMFQVVHRLKELFARTMNSRKLELDSNKSWYRELFLLVLCFREKIVIQTRLHVYPVVPRSRL